MGRELRRVPLDFNWPIDEVWSGFINENYEDHSKKCPFCGGGGLSLEGQALSNRWYGWGNTGHPLEKFVPTNPHPVTHPSIQAFAKRNCERSPDFYGNGSDAIDREAQRLADLFNKSWSHHLREEDVKILVKENRLHDFTHTYESGHGWKKKKNCPIPTAEEVNAWSMAGGIGHDSINAYILIEAECKRLKVPYLCGCCKGEGKLWRSAKHKKNAESWKRTDPPTGPGYQVWETVSEGSPISPVFATPEELAQHMTTTRWGADKGTSYESWMKFICGDGWAPSGIMINGEYVSGVEGVAQLSEKE